MYWSNGCRYVCYEGLAWDGRGKAAVLVGHQSQSYYETWIRYLHCAFLNGRDYGVVVGLGESKSPSAEIYFRNCLFDNCGEGTALLAPNDYDNIFDACEFDHCGIGIHGVARQLADSRLPVPGQPGVGRKAGQHLAWGSGPILCLHGVPAISGDLPRRQSNADADRGLPYRWLERRRRGNRGAPPRPLDDVRLRLFPCAQRRAGGRAGRTEGLLAVARRVLQCGPARRGRWSRRGPKRW